MSIPLLVEVYDEVRRLAIAGSAVAPGDFRLKKLVAPLAKAGEKAPVFAKVAQSIQAVVDSTEKTAAAALLELTTLVNAILYTQGETGLAGEMKPLETIDLGAHVTQASARVLKPLLEALNSTGSGRLELIRDAVGRGAFKDLRLVKPALRALDDPYPEISDLIAKNVLPLYGKAVLQEVRATLDIKGRGGHVRRLQILHRLDPETTRSTVQQVLSEGSKEMKIAAMGCLGSSDEDVAYLLDQAKSKTKDVRTHALSALAKTTGNANTIAALKKAIDSEDLYELEIRNSAIPEIQDYILQQAETTYVELPKIKDKKKQGEAVARLNRLLRNLEGRTDAKAESFLLNCLENVSAFEKIKSEPSGTDFNELLARMLLRGTATTKQRLAASHATLSSGMVASAYFAARSTKSPAAFYDEFNAILKPLGLSAKLAKKDASERAEALSQIIKRNVETLSDEYDYDDFDDNSNDYADNFATNKSLLPPLDPRWLDAAIQTGDTELICDIARPGHEGANRHLSDNLMDKKHVNDHVVETMVRVKHPDATDALIAGLKVHAKETYYYGAYFYAELIASLPKSAVAKLEELLPTLPEKIVDDLIESVNALKNKPE